MIRGQAQRNVRKLLVRLGSYALAVSMLVLGVAPAAFADWIKMGGNDSVDAYMDLDLLQKKGEYVLSWRLYDYRDPQKTPSGKTFRSAATLVATRCVDRTEAMLSFMQYTEAMGKGGVVASREIPHAERQVSKITPGSIGEALNKVACQRIKMW